MTKLCLTQAILGVCLMSCCQEPRKQEECKYILIERNQTTELENPPIVHWKLHPTDDRVVKCLWLVNEDMRVLLVDLNKGGDIVNCHLTK